MTQNGILEDWREATRDLRNVRVVAIDEPTFFTNENTDVTKHIAAILDVLEHAQRDGVTYVVFKNSGGRLPRGILSRRAVTHFAITRAAYTSSYIKRVGCQRFDGALLAEIRERPSPAERERQATFAKTPGQPRLTQRARPDRTSPHARKRPAKYVQ